jgi:hypothetical protein
MFETVKADTRLSKFAVRLVAVGGGWKLGRTAACALRAPRRSRRSDTPYVGDDNVEVRSSLDGARASLRPSTRRGAGPYEGSVALDAPSSPGNSPDKQACWCD